jgi:hypothetical protein
MSLLSNVGKGLIRWTPKIAEASADDIARFGPQAARVRALLNFIPGMSDDAAKISDAAWGSAWGPARRAKRDASRKAAMDASRYEAWGSAYDALRDRAWGPAREAAVDAAGTEVVSDLITPEIYRTVTNPMASARALDRLAGRAPESFIPVARDLGERGLVSAPADIVTALRVSKLPQQQQSLVMGLVDSGMTIEDALLAARALS